MRFCMASAVVPSSTPAPASCSTSLARPSRMSAVCLSSDLMPLSSTATRRSAAAWRSFAAFSSACAFSAGRPSACLRNGLRLRQVGRGLAADGAGVALLQVRAEKRRQRSSCRACFECVVACAGFVRRRLALLLRGVGLRAQLLDVGAAPFRCPSLRFAFLPLALRRLAQQREALRQSQVQIRVVRQRPRARSPTFATCVVHPCERQLAGLRQQLGRLAQRLLIRLCFIARRRFALPLARVSQRFGAAESPPSAPRGQLLDSSERTFTA